MDDDTVFDIDGGRCELDTYLLFKPEWSAMEATYVVLDVEVTERLEHDGEIMGLQALLISPEGAKLSALELLVQSQRPAPDWLLDELQLDAEYLAAHALEEGEALQLLKEFVGQHPVFVHQAAVDMPFLHRVAERCGLHFSNPVLDTLAIAELTWPGERCSQYALSQLLELKHPLDQPLSADVMTTWKILLAARELAQSVHAMHIQAAGGAGQLPTPPESSAVPVICPFCRVRHPFYP